jgi:hypothetical protein
MKNHPEVPPTKFDLKFLKFCKVFFIISLILLGIIIHVLVIACFASGKIEIIIITVFFALIEIAIVLGLVYLRHPKFPLIKHKDFKLPPRKHIYTKTYDDDNDDDDDWEEALDDDLDDIFFRNMKKK